MNATVCSSILLSVEHGPSRIFWRTFECGPPHISGIHAGQLPHIAFVARCGLDCARVVVMAGTTRDFLLAFSAVEPPSDGAVERRAQLLLEAARDFSSDDFIALVEECYRVGDNAEKVAVLRALPELPEPTRFLPLAVEACRSNVASVFEAIVCDNSFPARHFPDANLNQAVLKVFFMELSVQRVLDLPRRVNAELQRMLRDFSAERRAAGRPVPEGVGWLLELEVPR